MKKKRVIEKNEYELTLFKKKYKYEYNSIDSVSRMYVYNDDGDLDEEWTYEYDNQKRLIRTTEKEAWNFVYVIQYRYEGNNIYIGTTKVRIKSDKQKNVAKLLADRRFRKMA